MSGEMGIEGGNGAGPRRPGHAWALDAHDAHHVGRLAHFVIPLPVLSSTCAATSPWASRVAREAPRSQRSASARSRASTVSPSRPGDGRRLWRRHSTPRGSVPSNAPVRSAIAAEWMRTSNRGRPPVLRVRSLSVHRGPPADARRPSVCYHGGQQRRRLRSSDAPRVRFGYARPLPPCLCAASRTKMR